MHDACTIANMSEIISTRFVILQNVARKYRLDSFLNKRKQKRQRSAEFIQRQVGKWAAEKTGLSLNILVLSFFALTLLS